MKHLQYIRRTPYFIEPISYFVLQFLLWYFLLKFLSSYLPVTLNVTQYFTLHIILQSPNSLDLT